VKPRDRVLRTMRFEETDRVPYDLMEGAVWPELLEYFCERYGHQEAAQVLDYLDTDLRWIGMRYEGPERPSIVATGPEGYTKAVSQGPLADAATVEDLSRHDWPDPAWWLPADYAAYRARYPDHALVYVPGWMPLFWTACEVFGMEQALVNMIAAPRLFEAFVERQHAFYMDLLSRGLRAARGHCDICWLGDDYASQKAMIMGPSLWRRFIKPYLGEQVRAARDAGLYVLFHSCGAVRPILPDLIDIGVNALLVFQTTATGMSAPSIAAEFGGRLAFYGGIDIQQLLSFGTEEEVEAEVLANVRAFEHCGGYVVANAHHRVSTVQGRNIEAMCKAARRCTYPLATG